MAKDSKVKIGDFAFAECDNLYAFVISGDTMPIFGSSVFDYTASDFAIYYSVHVMNGNANIDKADASIGFERKANSLVHLHHMDGRKTPRIGIS